jgi:hypothetical protein
VEEARLEWRVVESCRVGRTGGTYLARPANNAFGWWFDAIIVLLLEDERFEGDVSATNLSRDEEVSARTRVGGRGAAVVPETGATLRGPDDPDALETVDKDGRPWFDFERSFSGELKGGGGGLMTLWYNLSSSSSGKAELTVG